MVSSQTDTKSLEKFISANGSMNWRQCLSQFHDICLRLEQTDVARKNNEDISIASFTTKAGDTSDDTIIEFTDTPLAFTFPVEAYMSPEKCLDKAQDIRSDIYSLGCVIYHCLTGAPPFLHRDLDKLKEMQAIDYALPPGRRAQRHYIPDEVDFLVARCLEKNPATRFQTMSELRAEIGKTLQVEDVFEREPDSRSSKFKEFLAQRRNVFAIAFGLIAITIGLALYSLNTAVGEEFLLRRRQSIERHRNRYYLGVESGPSYDAQMDFGQEGRSPSRAPLELKVQGEDTVLFATTQKAGLKDALQEAVKRRVILYRVDLDEADLTGSTIPGIAAPQGNFLGTQLQGADMTGAILARATFNQANLSGAKLIGMNATMTHFVRTNFEGADLSNSIMIKADLTGASFRNCNLSGATIVDSTLKDNDFTGAIVNGLRVSDDVFEKLQIPKEQLAQVQLLERKKPRKATQFQPLGDRLKQNAKSRPLPTPPAGVPQSKPQSFLPNGPESGSATTPSTPINPPGPPAK